MQRALLAAIDNTEAIAAPQRVDYSNPSLGATEADRTRLDEVAVRAAFQREHDERVDAAAELRQHGQDDAAAGLDAEVAVIASYLARMVRRVRTADRVPAGPCPRRVGNVGIDAGRAASVAIDTRAQTASAPRRRPC